MPMVPHLLCLHLLVLCGVPEMAERKLQQGQRVQQAGGVENTRQNTDPYTQATWCNPVMACARPVEEEPEEEEEEEIEEETEIEIMKR